MKRKLTQALFFTALFVTTISKAQWSTDYTVNTPVCLANNSQFGIKTITDGNKGVFMVWQDNRLTANNANIYMQHLDSLGVPLWTVNGIPICTAANAQESPDLASDGNGGAIVVWHDLRNATTTSSDIYAQRVDNNGNIQWALNGVPVCSNPSEQSGASIIADNAGGAYITWAYDNRSSASDVFVQHIDNTGASLWITDGLSVSSLTDEYNSAITSDGNGGVIITWMQSFTKLYAQRFNAAGVAQWAANGVVIRDNINDVSAPKIVSDNMSGAIISWIDSRVGTDVYAQRVNSAGAVLWTVDGVVVSGASGNKWGLKMSSNGNNGACFVWVDARSGVNNDIYAQHIDGLGTSIWATDGKVISNANYDQGSPDVCEVGNGNVIITWDSNIDFFGTTTVYAKKLNALGASQWLTDSVEIGVLGREAVVLSDEIGGAIITFVRGSNSSSDIYAQHICYSGFLGTTANPILSIAELQTGIRNEIFASGTTTASSDFFSTPASSAFDFNTTLYGWATNGFSMPEWLEHDFGSGFGQTVDTYELYFSSTMVGLGSMGLDEMPKSWFFLASNDGITWDTLDRRTNQTLAFDVVASFPIQNTTAYEKYRIYITNTVSNSVTFITELKLIQHFPNMCSNRMYVANSNTPEFYQNLDWQLNGVSLGVSNDTLILPTTNNGDVVSCIITSTACVFSSNVDTSNIVVVNTMGFPSITVTGNTNLCLGQTLTTTLTASGGVSYQWLNGPATDTFTVSLLADSSFTVSVIDTNGCLGNYTQLVTVSSCTGLSEYSEMSTSQLNIYPNPNNGSFTLRSNQEGIYYIRNELGQLVNTIKVNASNNYSASITDLQAGIYFVVGIDNGARQKIVVTK